MPTTSQTEKVIALATLADKAFVLRKRDNGDEFWSYDRDSSPEWLQDVCREAHAGMLPDDHKYEMIRDAFAEIAEQDESTDLEDLQAQFADSEVSVYNAELAEWLASHLDRGGYVDAHNEDFGAPEDMGIYERIAAGWYVEASEVYGLVLSGLQAVAEDEEAPGEESDGKAGESYGEEPESGEFA